MTPSFNKTRLGFDPVDKALGGIYFFEPTLIWGPRHSGKSLLSAQFAAKVLQTGERICVMVENNPRDFFLDLQSVNVDVGEAVGSGQLLALSCKGIADAHPAETGAAAGGPTVLPFPEAIEELRQLVTAKSIPFFIFNSVIPWVAVPPDEVTTRVETFVSALESMQLTSLLLLPRPASPAATRLRDTLADACPVVLQLTSKSDADRRILVTHYHGASNITLPVDYPAAILPGRGFVAREEANADSIAPQPIPSLAARPTHRHAQHHHALLPPSAASSPPPSAPAAHNAFLPVPPSAADNQPAVPHPRHASRHHALIPPGAGAPPQPAPAKPAPAPAPAPTRPAPAPAPAPAQAPAQPAPAQPREGSPTKAENANPATAPKPGDAASETPSPAPRRHRFSTVIK